MPISLDIELSSLVIYQDTFLEASPAKVYEALTGDLSDWWGSPFLVGGEAAEGVFLEAELGGKFYERWAGGGGHLLGTVTTLAPGRYLKLQGYLSLPGPLSGVLEFDLEPKDGGTMLQLFHSAVGSFHWQAEEHYKTGWAHLIGTRLKEYVEQGKKIPFQPE